MFRGYIQETAVLNSYNSRTYSPFALPSMKNVCKSKAFEIVVLKKEIFCQQILGLFKTTKYSCSPTVSLFFDTKMMKEILERPGRQPATPHY